MAQDPWAQFRVQPTPTQPAMPAEDPIIRPVDPYKANAEARANQDQGFEAARLEMERQRLALAQQEAGDKNAKEAAEVAQKTTQQDQVKQDTISKLRRTIDNIDKVAMDAMDNGGWGDEARIAARASKADAWASDRKGIGPSQVVSVQP